MRKILNCWEYNNCGREKGGLMVPTLGECSTQSAMKYDGLNNGIGAGRACWLLEKGKNCILNCSKFTSSCCNCRFYKRVHFEEQNNKNKKCIVLKRDLIEI